MESFMESHGIIHAHRQHTTTENKMSSFFRTSAKLKTSTRNGHHDIFAVYNVDEVNGRCNDD